MRADRFALLVVLAGILFAGRGASAQDEDTRSEAARLFKSASSDFAAARYERAAQAFEASHRLVPRAAALYSAARAWDASGALDRAADDYEDALAHTDLHGAEADDAHRRLAQIRPLVAVVAVQAPDDARVWLGHVEGVLGPVRTHLLPGDYMARVERSGDQPWTQPVHATAGADVSLVAALVPLQRPAPPPAHPHTSEAPRRPSRAWTWVALGVAAAGAIASGILYAETVHARDQFDGSGDRDPHLRDAATSWRTATYAAYGVTATALAAGVTLAFVW